MQLLFGNVSLIVLMLFAPVFIRRLAAGISAQEDRHTSQEDTDKAWARFGSILWLAVYVYVIIGIAAVVTVGILGITEVPSFPRIYIGK